MPRGIRITLLLLVLVSLAAYAWLDHSAEAHPSHWLGVLKSQRDLLATWRDAHPLLAGTGYLLMSALLIGLMLPVAALLMVFAGAVFGFGWGVPLASFGVAVGCLLAFWLARVLLGDLVRRRWSKAFERVDRALRRDGAWYLFSLRLIPVMPGFLLNLLMGLAPIRARTFYWVSQLGSLASVVVYVNAGTQLASIDTLDDVWSARVVLSFLGIALLPWVARVLIKPLAAAGEQTGSSRH